MTACCCGDDIDGIPYENVWELLLIWSKVFIKVCFPRKFPNVFVVVRSGQAPEASLLHGDGGDPASSRRNSLEFQIWGNLNI
jgi:hypothetical protein